MEKKKKFRSKILTLAFCGLAALSMSAATTFAWFTQNITPKVSQFGMKVITANDDLNIAFNYKGSNWSPFGPSVAAKYFGVDGTGTALAADSTIGFFESADDGSTSTLETYRLTNFSTSKYVNGEDDITTAEFDSTGGLLKLYDRDGDSAGNPNNTLAGVKSGTYLKLTFKFQSATQYNVILNTQAGAGDTTELKNTYVRPVGSAPATVRNRAWAEVSTVEGTASDGKALSGAANYTVAATSTLDSSYSALTEGETLNTRGAFAIRLGFVGSKVLSEAGTEGTALYYDSNAGTYVSTKNADCADTVYKATSNVINIWDPFETAVADSDGITGFPLNAAATNMAYQYERYNAAVMEEDEPEFVAPAASDIHTTAATTSWQDKVLVTLTESTETPGTYEGTLDVYIWLEGYDGDCFNDILNDVMVVAMQFKGVTPA